MDKREGRAAQTSSCHLTLAYFNFLKYTPLQSMLLPFCGWYFKFLGRLTQVSPPNIFAQNKWSMCKGCLREYPPSFPPSPHAYFQTNDLSLSRCVSQLSEGDVRLGVGNTLVCLNCLFPPLFVFPVLYSTYLISLRLSVRVSHQFKLLKCQTLRGYVTCQGI